MKPVQAIEEEYEESDESEDLLVSQIFIGEMGDSSEWTEEIMINGISIKIQA